jgi:hypothetical protein
MNNPVSKGLTLKRTNQDVVTIHWTTPVIPLYILFINDRIYNSYYSNEDIFHSSSTFCHFVPAFPRHVTEVKVAPTIAIGNADCAELLRKVVTQKLFSPEDQLPCHIESLNFRQYSRSSDKSNFYQHQRHPFSINKSDPYSTIPLFIMHKQSIYQWLTEEAVWSPLARHCRDNLKVFFSNIVLNYMAYEWLPEENYYSVLGVAKDATIQEIKKAYYAKARLFHTDKHQQDDDGAKIRMQTVNEAKEILLDPEKKDAYDKRLSY